MTDSTAQAHPDTRHAGAQKVFIVCFTEPAGASLDAIEAALPAHKRWAAEAEAAGQFFAAGPLLDGDYGYTGSGMIVLRAGSVAEAAAIVDADPMHAQGLRRYRLVPWQINEGSLTVLLTMSTGAATFA